jgi:tripartite-type tricarboxylate transporter receptor subunit TctC
VITRRSAVVFIPLVGSAIVSTISSNSQAQSQNYPSKPIRWVVPYPAGGGSDFLARTISQQLATQISQSILVDNKPGGNTALAASEVARSTADGYTILSADNGTMVFNSALYSKLSYNPEKDLVPVTLMGKFPMILVVGPSSDATDAKDFISKAKANSRGTNYGSAGAGSPHHLAMELLKINTGLNLVHIPYKGAAPSLADLVGGQIPAMMVDLASGKGFIKSGKVRALAIANPTRLPQLPDVPTFAELGLKNVEASAQVGIVAPVGTPSEVVNELQKQVSIAINHPTVKQKLIDFGIEPVASTPQQYAELIRSETIKWHKLIKQEGILLD